MEEVLILRCLSNYPELLVKTDHFCVVAKCGIKYGIQALCKAFEKSEAETTLLIYVKNAFHRLNQNLALTNVKKYDIHCRMR